MGVVLRIGVFGQACRDSGLIDRLVGAGKKWLEPSGKYVQASCLISFVSLGWLAIIQMIDEGRGCCQGARRKWDLGLSLPPALQGAPGLYKVRSRCKQQLLPRASLFV